MERVTCDEIDAAVCKRDKDWADVMLENWNAMDYSGEPNASYHEMCDSLRYSHLVLFDDREWANCWVAARQLHHLLEDCEEDDLSQLYESSSHKPWILASAIASSLRLGCDRAFTTYTLFKLAQVLDAPEQPSFGLKKVNIDKIPKCSTLEEFFSKIADQVLKAFGVTPTDHVRAPIVDIYMRILKNPGQHWKPPYTSKPGMLDADMIMAMRDSSTLDCFDRFDAEGLELIFRSYRPSRRDRSPTRK